MLHRVLVPTCVLVGVFSVTAVAETVLITAAKIVNPTDTTITATAGGSPVALIDADIIVRGATLTMNGRHTIRSMTIERNASNVEGVLTHTANSSYDYSGGAGSDIVHGLSLTTLHEMSIQGTSGSLKASKIIADARGHPSATGPGAGISGSDLAGGAGFGGAGRNASNSITGGDCYGSPLAPNVFGSGGGADTGGTTSVGGAGGGAIRLNVEGSLTIDGIISANGQSTPGNQAAGGSGGSIWITCATLAGSGSLTATGGGGNTSFSGGGGGGRVAIYYASGTYSGTFDASGGVGYLGSGGAGTFYIEKAGSLGTLYIDNADKSSAEGTEFTGSMELDANLVIRNGGLLSHKHQDAGVALTFAGDAMIESDGFINVNARGHPSATGPGAGMSGSDRAGGGGFGGVGGNGVSNILGGGTYGDLFTPILFGSGGGADTGGTTSVGGAGGGAIRLNVEGSLTIDGTISANGQSTPGNQAAGGSGGSIWITCATLGGSGSVTAIGGTGNTGSSGGGGGGRVAIYSCDVQVPLTAFNVNGGIGYRNGGIGTVYFGGSSVNIFLQPDSTTYTGGDEVSLIVDATGDGPLTYQWYREGEPLQDNDRISGATSDQLTFSPIDCADGGTFYCLVTDSCGSFPTDPAQIAVLAPSDYDGSGFVDTDDFTAFVIDFELGDEKADFDDTGFVDTDDFTAFTLAFEAGC
ncbi:MAG TPA: immunoglobulin domain-containing protein [Phycisphaerales bacterium]|nr:immunoglobulin domain-containing protein [Phycisphaerales bacterium]